jgi:hypothetical protein
VKNIGQGKVAGGVTYLLLQLILLVLILLRAADQLLEPRLLVLELFVIGCFFFD